MVTEEAESNKRQKEGCIINCLPSDLIEQVFFRLPVSTLLTCTGVCKQWKKFIRDPRFITSHLQHAPRYALLFFPQESISCNPYPSDAILIDEAWSHSTHAVPVIGPDDFLFGSCNGLLGLYTKMSTIKIANFATGQCLHLEKPIKNLKGDHFSLYSFGFHPVTKQYKVAHFLGDSIEGHSQNNDKFSIIQVYTLGDESWKDIRTPEALSLKCVRNSGVVNLDGTIYWLTEDIIASWKYAIMSFDLGDESFKRIQLPATLEDCAHDGPPIYWIREIDRKICLVTIQSSHYLTRRLHGNLLIWTLDDKMGQRWSQKYNIQYSPSPDYILGPNLVHRDKIMLQHRDCKLYSYELLGDDSETKMCKVTKLLDFRPHKPENMKSYICVKSLVSLDEYKKAGIVRIPRQREGWKLKRWEAWEHKLRNKEEMWNNIYELEHGRMEFSQTMALRLKLLLPRIPDEVTRQQTSLKISQIIPYFPDQQARSLRRLNCVDQKRDFDDLDARMDKYKDICEAISQTMDIIFSTLQSCIQVQMGTSCSNAGIISQNHGDNEDMET
ncbi:F-box protein CPR1 isoform X1 [Brachypodium distachyon]|uniref:F-box domain-containing protein n=1 Tax=Brachypodium distachyon TaxID=15368 RepID=A0A0Q3HB43_BRADI|nr:F-box protein CPR1 isoform X1 [Brachypodium distachyon]KQJ90660.1 hypothetical protein BRADI_4g33144v3 [Brachypodium distachyon]KQJ90666.1 hypothetical protein BRADI_4g33144v3 [Brachypodium distachyon]|eukprot:XP_014758568.1 F-box protein CPR1 isoform X1 [Brachypodium distachyon]